MDDKSDIIDIIFADNLESDQLRLAITIGEKLRNYGILIDREKYKECIKDVSEFSHIIDTMECNTDCYYEILEVCKEYPYIAVLHLFYDYHMYSYNVYHRIIKSLEKYAYNMKQCWEMFHRIFKINK